MQPSNAVQQLLDARFRVADPGNGKMIEITRDLQYVPLTIAASTSETRTIQHPTKAGLLVFISARSVGASGTAALTDADGSSPFDVGDDATITFAAVEDFVVLYSIEDSTTTFRWQVIQSGGSGITGITSNLSGAASVTTLVASSYIKGKGYLEVDGTTSGGMRFSGPTNGAYLITFTNAVQTTGTVTVTIPDFANVNDTFVFTTLAQTLVSKTLTAPVVNLGKRSVNATGVTATNAGANIGAKDTVKIIGVTGQTGYKVLLLTGVAGQVITLIETGGYDCKLGPASGGTINGGSANQTVTVTASHVMQAHCLAADTWYVVDLGALPAAA